MGHRSYTVETTMNDGSSWRYQCRLVVESGDGSSERSTLWSESMVLVGGGRWVARGRICGRCRRGPASSVRWTPSPDFKLYPWVGVADGGAGVQSVAVHGCHSLPGQREK